MAGFCQAEAQKAVLVDHQDFTRIASTQAGNSPYGSNWIQIYGGIMAAPNSVKPAALIGGRWSRENILLEDRSNPEQKLTIAADISFLRDHWSIAHEWAVSHPGLLNDVGRFGWTFGVSVGTLGATTKNSNDTDSSTDYFFGITYFINPQMSIAVGPVMNASSGLGKSRIGATVSIDLAAIGKFFGGK